MRLICVLSGSSLCHVVAAARAYCKVQYTDWGVDVGFACGLTAGGAEGGVGEVRYK